MSKVYAIVSNEIWIDATLELDIRAAKLHGIYSTSKQANRVAKAVTKTLWFQVEKAMVDSSFCEYWDRDLTSQGCFLATWKTKRRKGTLRPLEPFSFEVRVFARTLDDDSFQEVYEEAEEDSDPASSPDSLASIEVSADDDDEAESETAGSSSGQDSQDGEDGEDEDGGDTEDGEDLEEDQQEQGHLEEDQQDQGEEDQLDEEDQDGEEESDDEPVLRHKRQRKY